MNEAIKSVFRTETDYPKTMNRRITLQIMFQFAVIICGLALGASESLGPPPGARGTIDFRYPNYIVKPVPSCPSEGVYPHPANCTWYYRCYSYITHGQQFFRRSYFECEPGTVFSDALDQCIFPHKVGSCSTTPTCEDVTDGCATYEVCYRQGFPETRHLCKNAYVKCPSAGQLTPKCSDSQFYDPNTKQCVPDPRTTGCCLPTQTDCRTVRICTQAGNIEERYLCAKSFVCDREENLVPRCPSLSFFDPRSLMCVAPAKCSREQLLSDCGSYDVCDSSNVKSNEYLCKSAFKHTYDLTLVHMCPPKLFYFVTEDRCVRDPSMRPCPKCQPRFDDCSFREVCVDGKPQFKQLCGEAFGCDSQGQSWRRCPVGSYFDKDNSQCVMGSLEQLKCPTCEESYKGCQHHTVCYTPGFKQERYICREASKCVNNQPVPRCQPHQYFDWSAGGGSCISAPETYKCSSVTQVVETNKVTCSSVNSYPFEAWMKESCWRVNICNQGKTTLCKKYYQCVLQADGALQAVQNTCGLGYTFSYSVNQCIPKPKDFEICGIEFDFRKRI